MNFYPLSTESYCTWTVRLIHAFEKITYKGKIIQGTSTGLSLGTQSNILDQFVYSLKLPPYNPGSLLREVLLHSLLADSTALKKGLQYQ